MRGSLAALRRTLLGILSKIAFLGPLLARLSVGVVFAQSGWAKLQNLDKVTEFFTSLGIPYPELMTPFVASVEFVGGLLLLVGLLSRLAAVPLMITMTVAIITAKLSDVEGVADVLALDEFTYFAVLAWIVLAGPGALSLDALLARWLFPPAEPERDAFISAEVARARRAARG